MIIEKITKRKSGHISIDYREGGKSYGLSLSPQEIVSNFKAAQQGVHPTIPSGGEIPADVDQSESNKPAVSG